MKTALILAAGQGTRLREELNDRPKGLLRLGGRSIIEESIGRLAAHGVSDIIVVTGFAASHYEELARAYPSLLRTVHNPEFARSGSMYSLFCARDVIAGPFLLLESDLVYEPRALEILLKHRAQDVVLLSGPTGAGDEVYVEAPAGRLRAMSKTRSQLGEVAGELVGISKISRPLFTVMERIASGAFRKSLQFDYETDCLVAAAGEHAVACVLVPDLLWGEIDDPRHLRRVREIYPRIAACDAQLPKISIASARQ